MRELSSTRFSKATATFSLPTPVSVGRNLRGWECRRTEATIFVGVRITEHYLLHVSAARNELAIDRQREGSIHNGGATAKIIDCLEQRNNIDVAASVGAHESDLF